MKDEQNIRECPNCNGLMTVLCLRVDGQSVHMTCFLCGMRGPIGDTGDIAITLWNRLPRRKCSRKKTVREIELAKGKR